MAAQPEQKTTRSLKMPEVSRRKLFAGLAALPFAGTLALRGDEPVPAHKFAPRLSGREVIRRRYFPNVELVTHTGKKVKFYDDVLKDKIVVLNLMYANCEGVCPTSPPTSRGYRNSCAKISTTISSSISMTVRPEQDSPDTLREYAKMHGIKDKYWTFLTGKAGRRRHAAPRHRLCRSRSRTRQGQRRGTAACCATAMNPWLLWGPARASGEPEWIAQEIGFAIPRQFKKHPAVNE